tara:strand:- start:865 stop:2271 length:1407 start_codon:yes stop_codon:yes gene_type:complete
MRQALLFIMTIPGIPVIYYGTEQELTGMRQTMFKGGAGSPDRDHFDTENEYFKFVQGLVEFRKSYEVFRRGDLKILRDNPYGPGLFIYEMTLDDVSAVVLINTSESLQLVDGLNLSKFKAGNHKPSYSLGSQNKVLSVSKKGNINMILHAKSAQIYMNTDEVLPVAELLATIEINNDFPKALNKASIQVTGEAKGLNQMSLVLDGDYEHLLPIMKSNQNDWSYDLNLSGLINGEHRIAAIGYDDMGSLITTFKTFNLALPTEHLYHYDDELGDDHGPNGLYTYPSHSSFGHQQDVRSVDLFLTGNNLTLDIIMSEITQTWLPPNGFDHVLLNIYMDIPDQDGIKYLPFQNAFFPNEGEWDYRFALGGFSIEAFQGQAFKDGTETLGVPIMTPMVNVDHNRKTISVTLTAKMLGNPATLDGAKLYINTWAGSAADPRAIDKVGATWTYGGSHSKGAKIMDDTHVITLKL